MLQSLCLEGCGLLSQPLRVAVIQPPWSEAVPEDSIGNLHKSAHSPGSRRTVPSSSRKLSSDFTLDLECHYQSNTASYAKLLT